MNGHGLSRQTAERIQEVLTHHPEVERAVLFGSRAKGTARPGSDIDLALYGEGLDWRVLGRIEDELDDLILPYTFSLLRHDNRTDSAVAAHIARMGLPFYQREDKAAAGFRVKTRHRLADRNRNRPHRLPQRRRRGNLRGLRKICVALPQRRSNWSRVAGNERQTNAGGKVSFNKSERALSNFAATLRRDPKPWYSILSIDLEGGNLKGKQCA